jgi:hypothetical protein
MATVSEGRVTNVYGRSLTGAEPRARWVEDERKLSSTGDSAASYCLQIFEMLKKIIFTQELFYCDGKT